MAKAVKTVYKDTMSWNEVQLMIKDYCNGYRKKNRPPIAQEIVANNEHFLWSETYKKYYSPQFSENRIHSRFNIVLQNEGYNPQEITYQIIW